MSKLYFVTGTTSDCAITLAVTPDESVIDTFIVNGATHTVTADAAQFAIDALDSGDFFAIEATLDSAQIILAELARLELDETHWIPSANIASAKAFIESVINSLLDVE